MEFIKYSTALTSLALLPEAIFADDKNKQKLANNPLRIVQKQILFGE